MNKTSMGGRIPPLRRVKPSEWGVGMTVCISVACDCIEGKIPKVVLVSDTLLSLGITSTRTLKARGLAKDWSVMFAGADVSHAESVMILARHKGGGGKGTNITDPGPHMVEAYQEVRRKQIEQLYLGTFGWTMTDFLQQGPDVPTPAQREYLLNEMVRFDLGCTFLVSGFSSPVSRRATIFEVHNPGQAIPQLITGYSAIGSGSLNAVAYLARRSQGDIMTLEESLYNAIAAKKLAEKALGVGGETEVIILERDKEDVDFLTGTQITEITKIWNDEEAYIRPRHLENRIAEILKPPAKSTEIANAKPASPTES